MADYYTYFSCLLDVKTAKNARKAQIFYETLKPQDGSANWDFALSLISSAPSQLWFDGDINGAPEHVREFALHCASTFGLSGRWGFEWSLCRYRHKDHYAVIGVMQNSGALCL